MSSENTRRGFKKNNGRWKVAQGVRLGPNVVRCVTAEYRILGKCERKRLDQDLERGRVSVRQTGQTGRRMTQAKGPGTSKYSILRQRSSGRDKGPVWPKHHHHHHRQQRQNSRSNHGKNDRPVETEMSKVLDIAPASSGVNRKNGGDSIGTDCKTPNAPPLPKTPSL